MGEWSYQHYDRPCDIVDIATMQPVMSVDANEADMAIEAHNADIAAYEARIAALEAELDRVNATLDRLREAVPEGNWIYVCSEIRLLRVVVAVRKLLYPKETDNG